MCTCMVAHVCNQPRQLSRGIHLLAQQEVNQKTTNLKTTTEPKNEWNCGSVQVCNECVLKEINTEGGGPTPPPEMK